MNNGGCQDKCINSPGSFSCLCTRLGFVVAADNKSCISEFVSLCVVRAAMPRTLPSLSGCLPYLFICSFYLSFSLFLSLLSFFSSIISCLSFIFLYPISSVFFPFLSVLPSTSTSPSVLSFFQVNLPFSVQVVDSVYSICPPRLHLSRGQTSKLLTQLLW